MYDIFLDHFMCGGLLHRVDIEVESLALTSRQVCQLSIVNWDIVRHLEHVNYSI